MNETSPVKRHQVLCIDDEMSNLKVRKLLLEYAGFSVLTASSGKEGLELFASRPIDAVIVDYSMPEMDGGIVAEQIKLKRARTPIIMLSAYPGARATVDKIVDAFVDKGGDPRELLERLTSLIKIRSHAHPEIKSEYVVFMDSARRFLDCSDAVCRLIGYSRTELLERITDDISYHREEAAPLFELYRQRGRLEGEFILRHKNGQPVPIRYRAWLFPDGCMAATWEPLTNWKQLHRAALLELDPSALRSRVEVALLAVHQRMRDLGGRPTKVTAEWVALSDALHGLRALQKNPK